MYFSHRLPEIDISVASTSLLPHFAPTIAACLIASICICEMPRNEFVLASFNRLNSFTYSSP